MIYCIDPNCDEPIMLLNKHVGFDEKEGQGIDGSLFQAELLLLDGLGKKRIQVWINSPGGVVMDGYNIYSAILKTKTKVDTYCVGIAASIAAVIFQAGRTRYMADYGKLMYHDPYGGNSKELFAMTDSIATMVSSRAGKDVEFIKAVMKRTTWISATEAKIDGFCDEVEDSGEQNRKRATSAPQEPMAMHRVANSILGETFSKSNFHKTINMIKVTNKLGLNPDASEDSIMSAIAGIENKLATAEGDALKAKNALAEKAKEVETLTSDLNSAKAKLKKDEDAKAKAEEELEAEKAKNMLDGFVKSGKITADSVNVWGESVKALGVDKVKDMLEKLPVNKVANKIDIQESNAGDGLTRVVASAMSDIRTKLKL